MEVKEESKASFSTDPIIPHLKVVLRTLKDSILPVRLEYSTRMPIRIETYVMRYGRIHFYLAPRVQD